MCASKNGYWDKQTTAYAGKSIGTVRIDKSPSGLLVMSSAHERVSSEASKSNEDVVRPSGPGPGVLRLVEAYLPLSRRCARIIRD